MQVWKSWGGDNLVSSVYGGEQHMDAILEYIEQNLEEEITLYDLSQKFAYSTRQMYYIIKELTGMPIMSYIRVRRLNKAANQIAQGRRLYDVAMDYGFETQAGFYKAFQMHMGCSPKEYQRHEQLHKVCKSHISIEKIIQEGILMEDIQIRKVKQEDCKSVWENIFSSNTPVEVNERIAAKIQAMDKKLETTLVAVIDDQVIGMVSLVKEDYILYTHRCHLGDFVVHPSFQKQGIGRRLFQEACNYVGEMDCSLVVTTCRGDGAEKFYRALGMRECGCIPKGITEPWGHHNTYDEYLFVKEE